MAAPPPRSASSSALATPLSGSSTPGYNFVRSTSGPLSAFAASSSSAVTPLPRDSPGLGSLSGGPGQFSQSVPSPLAASAASSYLGHAQGHGNYDARLVASTINKIEAASGLGGAINAVGSSSTGSTSAGLGSSESDAWTAVCIRTLPLFNGEGQRGYLESLNELVTVHIKQTVQRIGMSTAVISALTSDLIDVLAMGMLTLNAKLSNLNDEKLLIRITEVWNFFFIGCLPYIEGIFLPLRTDASLQQIAAKAFTGNSGHTKFGSGGSDSGQDRSTYGRSIETIDIRKLALRSFRDHLVLPIVDRLAVIFSATQNPGQSQPVEPGTYANSSVIVVSTARTASARRLQMVSILASVQTDDDRQTATEALAKALRAGMDKRPSMAASSNLNFKEGLYGAGYFSRNGSEARGASEAERKAWRRGRHIRPESPYADIGKKLSSSNVRDADYSDVSRSDMAASQVYSPNLGGAGTPNTSVGNPS